MYLKLMNIKHTYYFTEMRSARALQDGALIPRGTVVERDLLQNPLSTRKHQTGHQ